MTEIELTLAFDIGGTRIKSQTVDPSVGLVGGHVSCPTPRPATPAQLTEKLVDIATSVQFDRVSVGFPGLVRVFDGVIVTAPNLDGNWRGFGLVPQPGIVSSPRLVLA